MKWKTELIYKDANAFEQDINVVKDNIAQLKSMQNIKSVEDIDSILMVRENIEIAIGTLYSYCSMRFDQNQKDVDMSVELQNMMALYSDFISSSSFIEPGILKFKLSDFDKRKDLSKINEYAYYLKKVFNNQKYILTEDKEFLLSNFVQITSNQKDLYDMLSNSDELGIEVELVNHEKVFVTNGNYTSLLDSNKLQENRRRIFEAHYKFFNDHKNTYAGIYKGVLLADVAEMKSRGYQSTLDMYLTGNAIPASVYHSLLEVAKSTSHLVNHYNDLRRKFFNLEKYHTYDRFLTFNETEFKYTYQEAKDIVLKSLCNLSQDLYEHGLKALEDGRVDVYPNIGKRSGAYSTGQHNKGSFILLNHNDSVSDMFTLAHEAGHSIHTLYSSENQPAATENYVIFVAEVASTFNEQLLLDYLLETSQDKEFKISIIQSGIESLIGTFYRQSLFAEYELKAHQLAEKNEAITHESLSNIMIELYKQYFNIDIKSDEELKRFVWCYIPHFYHAPYYVYQYATSFSASLAIYQNVIKDKGNLEKYLDLLKSGGSDYPINLVKKAGIDLTRKETFEAVANRLQKLIKALEELL